MVLHWLHTEVPTLLPLQADLEIPPVKRMGHLNRTCLGQAGLCRKPVWNSSATAIPKGKKNNTGSKSSNQAGKFFDQSVLRAAIRLLKLNYILVDNMSLPMFS